MGKLALAFVAVAIFGHASSASAGGIKWAKSKWSCKDTSQAAGAEFKGNYSAPKGWVRKVDREDPPCPRSIRVEAPDGSARLELATVRAQVSAEERAKWHIQDAKVTKKSGWVCGEGIAVDWNGNPATPPMRVVRCAKELKGGGVIVGALMASEEMFAKLGGQKALLAAMKLASGLRAPLGQES